MTDPTTARGRAIEDLARRIELEGEMTTRPGQLAALEQVAWEVRALAAAPDATAPRWRVDDLTIMGEYVCARVDGCTCGPFDGQHESHCGYEPIADLSAVRGLLEFHAAPAAAAIERDEAARAVVRAWNDCSGPHVLDVAPDLACAVDELARAYEDGGRDR